MIIDSVISFDHPVTSNTPLNLAFLVQLLTSGENSPKWAILRSFRESDVVRVQARAEDVVAVMATAMSIESPDK